MAEQILIGVLGAVVGVLGWLGVGLFINRREASRRARNAGRAVYFEMGANQLAIFTALEYGMFGPLNRSSYDQLLPELATWLPAAELQALALAYLGQGGYRQLAEDPELPADARKSALAALLEAHRVAVELLRREVFSEKEIAVLDRYASQQHAQMMEAASRPLGDREATHG